MKLLTLGGTNDAIRIAESLHQQGIKVIYSLAGIARTPNAAFTVISGGFSQYGGLNNYIEAQAITGILDATHPYANNISDLAFEAAEFNGIPYWQFIRPAWKQQARDQWFEYDDWSDLLPLLEQHSISSLKHSQLRYYSALQLSLKTIRSKNNIKTKERQTNYTIFKLLDHFQSNLRLL